MIVTHNLLLGKRHGIVYYLLYKGPNIFKSFGLCTDGEYHVTDLLKTGHAKHPGTNVANMQLGRITINMDASKLSRARGPYRLVRCPAKRGGWYPSGERRIVHLSATIYPEKRQFVDHT